MSNYFYLWAEFNQTCYMISPCVKAAWVQNSFPFVCHENSLDPGELSSSKQEVYPETWAQLFKANNVVS